MLTKLKKKVQDALSTEARVAHRIGLTPNTLSTVGLILSIFAAAAYFFALSRPILLIIAIVLLLASGFCDTLDGIIARTYQQATTFGGFFDSLLDRYADAIIYSSIIIGGLCDIWWGLACLAGSLLVSYGRARAEAAGIKMESIGIAERAERMLILAAATLAAFFWLPSLNWGIAIIAVLSHITVLQRGLFAYRMLKKKENSSIA